MIRQHIHQPPATTGGLQARSNTSWYRCEMRMLALGIAGVFTLAACSGGSSTADSPTTTIVEPPVSAQPATTAAPVTTTTSTTTPATTSTTPTTTEAPIVVVQPSSTALPVDAEALFTEAFAGYEEAWNVLRSGYRDPSDTDIRSQLERLYVDPILSFYVEALDGAVAEGFHSVLAPDRENRVAPIRLLSTAENGSEVSFLVCETLDEQVVDSNTNEIIYDGTDSYLQRVLMGLSGGDWIVLSETNDAEHFGSATCEESP